MFPIDPKDPTPLYAQLERGIRLAIATGRLEVGERLPTVRQLAVELKVNANTVAKVYGELERAGVLGTRRGVGTFVKAREPEPGEEDVRARRFDELAERFLEDVSALGLSVEEAIERLRLRVQRERTSDA